jgi:endonuclease YncB( thermonuclease family)
MRPRVSQPVVTRYAGRRNDGRLFVALLLLLGLIGLYTSRQHTTEPRGALSGRARVLDGDSIEIAHARIRLAGIDAPEWDQTCLDGKGQPWACGRAAARELERHIAGGRLTCRSGGVDKYRRILAICFAPDGSDINAWMVRQGWAVAFGDVGDYRSEQHEAEAARRGMWAGSFLLPAQWRRHHP